MKPEDEAPRAHALYEDLLPGGKHWSFVLRRGTLLELVDC